MVKHINNNKITNKMKTLKEKIHRLMVMVSIIKNMPLLGVRLASKRWNTLVLADNAQQIHTNGDPLATAPPVTDAVLHTAASTLMTYYDGYKATPQTASKSQVTQQRNIVINMYNKDALYIQSVSRDAAIAAGDISNGVAVVTRCGFKIKKPSPKPPKYFKVVSNSPGSVDITSRAVAKDAGYIREYGIVSAKDLVPENTEYPVFSLEVSIHIDNLESGKIYAFREAKIVRSRRRSASSATENSVLDTATSNITIGACKAAFTHGALHYVWSDWVYVVIS
jgi:hypothetical protein